MHLGFLHAHLILGWWHYSHLVHYIPDKNFQVEKKKIY